MKLIKCSTLELKSENTNFPWSKLNFHGWENAHFLTHQRSHITENRTTGAIILINSKSYKNVSVRATKKKIYEEYFPMAAFSTLSLDKFLRDDFQTFFLLYTEDIVGNSTQ